MIRRRHSIAKTACAFLACPPVDYPRPRRRLGPAETIARAWLLRLLIMVMAIGAGECLIISALSTSLSDLPCCCTGRLECPMEESREAPPVHLALFSRARAGRDTDGVDIFGDAEMVESNACSGGCFADLASWAIRPPPRKPKGYNAHTTGIPHTIDQWALFVGDSDPPVGHRYLSGPDCPPRARHYRPIHDPPYPSRAFSSRSHSPVYPVHFSPWIKRAFAATASRGCLLFTIFERSPT